MSELMKRGNRPGRTDGQTLIVEKLLFFLSPLKVINSTLKMNSKELSLNFVSPSALSIVVTTNQDQNLVSSVVQGGRGHWTGIYSGAQSFITTLSYSLA